MSDTVNKNHPNARLCHILKWDHFDGYGFNLHAEKGKSGQYIGKVDDGSPAEAAGLRQGDRILEVNGESIANKNHKQVVEAIKGLPNETKLLVVDPNDEKQDDKQKTVDHSRPCDTVLMKTVNLRQEEPAEKILEKSDYSPPPDKIYEKDFTRNGQDQTPVMLNMTAAELRAKLKERKKFDPKKDGMDFKKKYDIVQKL
ncbi:hypothetical protein PPYR_05397 [Photinus pyralis]|uniref:PDZ domain-containing protein n=1 Tax=Photinus pyralis TaxID=7054 RepID=A0A1Y1MBZ0_PHOPY|nr:Na(+)/H(+) exchange regulatory cofactor NHE-RF1 [Photinus pyralis]KAB0801043.1 hypothetical protein PPYR_05397 [Photinus pyralis]